LDYLTETVTLKEIVTIGGSRVLTPPRERRYD